MDDGVTLLADRWVARADVRPAPADRARPFPVRAPAVRRAAVRPPVRRARPPGRDPERARHVRLGGRVQPVRRARRRARDAPVAARAAVACRADRDDGPELSRPRPMGGRARGRRRPRGARNPGQRLTVPRPDVCRRFDLARVGRVVARHHRRPGATGGAGRDDARAPQPAPAPLRAPPRHRSTSASRAPRWRGSARGSRRRTRPRRTGRAETTRPASPRDRAGPDDLRLARHSAPVDA